MGWATPYAANVAVGTAVAVDSTMGVGLLGVMAGADGVGTAVWVAGSSTGVKTVRSVATGTEVGSAAGTTELVASAMGSDTQPAKIKLQNKSHWTVLRCTFTHRPPDWHKSASLPRQLPDFAQNQWLCSRLAAQR